MNEIKKSLPWLIVGGAVIVIVAGFFLRRNGQDLQPAFSDETYELVTLLPRDAIPAISDPQFLTVAEADREYAPDELVLGVTINGDSRAYSTVYLNRHEIVNDTVGGRPIAVTW